MGGAGGGGGCASGRGGWRRRGSPRLLGAVCRSARIAGDIAAGVGSGRRSRANPGEFVADELALMLRDQPYQVRCLVAQARRMGAALLTVWEAFRRGDIDADQIRVMDRVARRVTETATLAAVDEQAVDAAQARSPKQLQVWLLRLVVQLEPLAFAQRHRRAFTERRVTVVQGADGMGYVTGEVSAADAVAIDALLAATSRSLGAEDPRTDQQRRADLFADLLLGRIALATNPIARKRRQTRQMRRQRRDTTNPTIRTSPWPAVSPPEEGGRQDISTKDASAEAVNGGGWLEVEDIDPETGELLGTRLQRLNAEGETDGEPVDASSTGQASLGRG